MKPTRRFVTDFFPSWDETSRSGNDTDDALLILNYHLPSVTSHVWNMVRPQRRVCADGGANRLYDELPELLRNTATSRDGARDAETEACFLSAVREAHVPFAIIGDLDSVRPEVLRFYRDRGCVTVDLRHDQDTTDLHKAVAWLTTRDPKASSSFGDGFLGAAENGKNVPLQKRAPPVKRNRPTRVLVTGALGGRFDHEMAHLSVLHAFEQTQIVLMGRTSSARLVPKGETVLVPDTKAEGPSCGLVPLLGPAVVTTSGLRWDLRNQKLTFGELISTSNRIRCGDDDEDEDGGGGVDAARRVRSDDCASRGEVRVVTDAPLVWTTDVTKARAWVSTLDFS
jgi:thiamine pyrophosphokinase